MNELISVIIPVYKVEKFLNQCLESVVNQTYSNLEIILVDDGSPDACGLMCDEWVKKDSRIQVIHKKNEGVSAARNSGMEIMTGDFVSFVDSDDVLHSSMYELLHNAIMQYNADIAICHEVLIYDNQECENEVCAQCEIEAVENREKLLAHFLDSHRAPSYWVWNKLYKASVVKNMRFDTNLLYSEDAYFNLEVYATCEKGVWIKQRLYYYRQREGSAMHSEIANIDLKHFYGMQHQLSVIKNQPYENLYEREIAFYLNDIARMEKRAYLYKDEEIRREWRKIFIKEYSAYKGKVRQISSKRKLFLARHFPILYHNVGKRKFI